MPMQLNGDAMRALADVLDAFGRVAGEVMTEALVAVAEDAAATLRETLPSDTGATRASVSVSVSGDVVTLEIGTDYASYIFEAGDIDRTPLYPQLLTDAFRQAVNNVGVVAQMTDLTEAYFGQGRTTTNITGPARKMTIHTPPHEVEAWRRYHPEMITRITLDGREIELVPSDFIDAGQAGVRQFRPRGL